MRTAAIDAALGRFAAAVELRLGPDVEVLGTSASRDPHGWSVRCDARAGARPLEVRLVHRGDAPRGDAPRGDAPGGAPGAHPHPRLTLRVTGEPAEGRALRGRLDARATDALTDALGALLRDLEPRAARSEPLDGARARALLGHDGALLAPCIDAFRRHYGEPLRAVFLEGDDAPSIAFPDVASTQAVFMHAPPPFREDVRMRAYLADLGFEVDAGARVSTVPVPSAFARRRARLGLAGDGLRPALVPHTPVVISPSGWLGHIARGVLPINVHGALAHALSRPLRRLSVRLSGSLRARWNNHFHALGHDMGLHALAMHRIGAAQLAQLRALASQALVRGRRSARRAASFFEERLTRACCDLWIDVRHPDRFEEAFGRALPSLLGELRAEGRLHG